MTTIMVDDTDGSIVYSGSWSPVQNSGAYAGSLHQTVTVNSSASLTFTGTSIDIYGTIPGCFNPTPTAYWISMRLANDTSADTSPPLFVSGLLPCASQPLNNVLFYSAETLSNEARVVGIHNLQDGFPLAVDFFSYVSGDAAVVSSSLVSSQTIKTMSATITLPSTISAIGATVFETVTVPTTIDGQATSVAIVIPTVISEASISPSTSPSKNATGRIVGGVVTSILGIFLLISLLFHWRRRRLLRKNINRTNDSLENFHLSGQEQGSRGAAAAPTMTTVQDIPPVLPPFPTSTSRTESSASDAPYSSNDVSYSSTFADSLPPSTVAAIEHLRHPHNVENPGSERGVISTSSNSANTFPSPLPLDEKRTAPYLLQWTPSSESIPLSPEAVPPTPSSASLHSYSPAPLRQSFLNRPASSIAPSEAAPAYYSRDPNTGNRPHYRSGMSTLTTATESIPPAYDAEHAPPLPSLPMSAYGFGFEPSRPASVESIPRR